MGIFALAAGFAAAVASVALWTRAATRGDTERVARWAVWTMAGGAAMAVAVLEWALVTHDFSVRFVAENGSTATPLFYTVTSLWAAHDGSLLLWLLVLMAYMTVAAVRPPIAARTLHPWAMAVLSVVGAFFFGLSLFASDTFQRVIAPPGGGPGPNPLLQDHPAMGIHPPLLYAGYVGLSVPFAYAVAGLITGRVDSRWLSVVRGYTLVAWSALTAGIVMGAWWSYAVLGWGGYWAWDPVENASLMPWLVATALLHASMVQRRRAALPAWNVSLAVTAFLLACVGTFLTRSGVLVSVHAFSDSDVGPVLLGFIVALAVGVAALVLVRTAPLNTPRSTGRVLSRGSALLANNVLLGCLTLTILLGTLFPLVAQATTGDQVSVGPPYYDRMAVPIALVLIALMAVGPVMRWDREDPARLVAAMMVPVLAGLAAVVVAVLLGARGVEPLAAFGLSAMVVATTVGQLARGVQVARATASQRPGGAVHWWLRLQRRRSGGLLAHLGLAVVVVGIAGSSAYTVSAQRPMHVGQQVGMAGTTARLVNVDRGRTAQAMTTTARLQVTHDGRQNTLTTALRYFPQQGMTVANPGIASRFSGDVYATLLSVNDAGTEATVRLAVNPLVGWIWFGGALTALGGVIALVPLRRRAVLSAAVLAPVPTPALDRAPETAKVGT